MPFVHRNGDGLVTSAFPNLQPGFAEEWVDEDSLDLLGLAKAEKRGQVNAARERRANAGVTFNGTLYDSDPGSVQKINGAVTLALIAQGAAQPFSMDWTTHDNSVVALDHEGMIGLGIALGQHVYAQHLWAREKKAEIDAAETFEALEAVSLDD